MLARANRVTQGSEYRQISRRGRRGIASGFVASAEASRNSSAPTRFGFIITKRVGVAVVRNRIRRRLKAISRELLERIPVGASIVIRVPPEAAEYSYEQLRSAVRKAVLRAVERVGVTIVDASSAMRDSHSECVEC